MLEIAGGIVIAYFIIMLIGAIIAEPNLLYLIITFTFLILLLSAIVLGGIAIAANREWLAAASVFIIYGFIASLPGLVRDSGGVNIVFKRVLLTLTPTFSVQQKAEKKAKLEILRRARDQYINERKGYYRDKANNELLQIKDQLNKKFNDDALAFNHTDLELVIEIGSNYEEQIKIQAISEYPSSSSTNFIVIPSDKRRQLSKQEEVLYEIKPRIKKALVEHHKNLLLEEYQNELTTN